MYIEAIDPIAGIIIITIAAVYKTRLPGKLYLLSTYAVAEQDSKLNTVQPTVSITLLKYIMGMPIPLSTVTAKLSFQFAKVQTSGSPFTLVRKSNCSLNEFIMHHKNGNSNEIA